MQENSAPRRNRASVQHRKKYVPAVGPRLRKLLFLLFGLFALLSVNAVYLVSISMLEWTSGEVYQNWFYLIMFLVHLILGTLIIIPVLAFGMGHLYNAYNRSNRRAVYAGSGLFLTALILLASGILLTRVEISGFTLGLIQPAWRSITYWLHVITPLLTIWLFVLHRLAGRRIRWKVGGIWGALAAGFALFMLVLQSQDPRAWNVVGNPKGDQYFQPSLARTVSGAFISGRVLDNNEYCQECHQDVHQSWQYSAHRFASFNNPAYLAAVRETRKVAFERDGSVQASRFCAGCHDPVPFFSGEFDQERFDDPGFDLAGDKSANAGITCTVCHSISHVNSPRGNADYTLDEPTHYPFATSQNPTLAWINRQLVKAKPEFHKKTFLKPLHRSAEFCGTCHKVHLPRELNHYKWLRGQNHYDSFWLSGVSGYGVASFYYPKKAEPNCNNCHMPLRESREFGAQDFDESGHRSVHDHQFPSANTALPSLLGMPTWVNQAHLDFLQEVMRVDLFGIRKAGRIDGELFAPLRPVLPDLRAGQTYLLETVIRTLKMGHLFTEGTADSNEVWLEITADLNGQTIGLSGGVQPDGAVDPWAHRVNSYVLDRDGNRIDRRNAQDIFVALYNNQIPPGAADVVHYALTVPPGARGRLTVEARLLYRKFDTPFVRFFQGAEFQGNPLPVIQLATDAVTFTLGQESGNPLLEDGFPEWQRWNDYGIGLLRRGQLRQSEAAFSQVERLGQPDGPLNRARVYLEEGLVRDLAPKALQRAREFQTPAPSLWTLLWLSGRVQHQNGQYDQAISNFQTLLAGGFPQAAGRNFDFSRDYRLQDQLAQSLFQRALQERGSRREEARQDFLRRAKEHFQAALHLDPENLEAHWGLKQIYDLLDDPEQEAVHARLHAKYKPDDNARDQAFAVARRNDPAASHAAQQIVIYDLHRTGAPRGRVQVLEKREVAAQ